MNQASNALKSGMKTIKDNLGLNEPSNEKNEVQDTEKEHELTSKDEPKTNDIMNQEGETINNDAEKVEDVLGLNKANDRDGQEEQRLTFSKNNNNAEQQKELLEDETQTRLNKELNKDNKNCRDEEDTKLNNKDERVRSYADVVSGKVSSKVDDQNYSMVAGDTSAFKDIKSNAFNSNTTDFSTLSQPQLNERDNEKELQATKDIIPSQNDIAPQINDASA